MKKKKQKITKSQYGAAGSLNVISMRFDQATVLFQTGRFSEVKILLNEILSFDSNHAESWYLSACIANHEELHQSAIEFLNKALRIDPHNLKYLYTLGDIYYDKKYLNEGIRLFEFIVEINPNDYNGLYNLAVFQQKQKQYEKSLENYRKVLDLDKYNINSIYNIGDILIDLEDYINAAVYFNRVIELQSNSDDALNNLGFLQLELGNYEEALEYLNQAISINSKNLSVLNNLGKVYEKKFLYLEALEYFNRAIILKPDYAEAYYNSGVVLQKLRHYEKALASHESAINIKSDYAEAYYERGNSLKFLERLEEALESYEIALELKPDCEYLVGALLHLKMHMCNWLNFEADVENLLFFISNGFKSTISFSVLALTDSLSMQLKSAESWINDQYPFNPSLGVISKVARSEKIKICYFSSDFCEHPISYLTVELFELHSKKQFELVAFYYGNADSSNMHKRVASAFDHFIDIRLKSDKEIAELSRVMGIDIAIDLSGSTTHGRVGIFAYRAAPIQVSYLGYLGSNGAKYYDYLIADKTIIPVKNQDYYKEKIVYLPSYQVNDSKRLISDKIFEKVELKFPTNGFVFCCFNNNYKIVPSTFDGWMRILNAVPDSILFLYASNKWAEANLKIEAEKRGVSQSRLFFGSRIERSEYIARYKVVDLFLDTLPYNAGTTASDALWAGIPVLTCTGESFASRMAASLLNAIELPELITTTQAEYEAKAIELGNNPEKLKAIKDKLERNRLTTALFDTPRFTKHIEAAFMKMYERYQSDLPPDHIYIDT
jgi:protein O-GlcNAc transferase